jgi:hypothetical protein
MNFDAIVSVRVRADLPVAIRAAARRRRLKPSEYIRNALREQVERDGVSLDSGETVSSTKASA